MPLSSQPAAASETRSAATAAGPTRDRDAAEDDDDDALEAGAEAGPTVATPRPGARLGCSFGAALGALATAAFIHYYIHAGGVAAAKATLPHNFQTQMKLKGIAGPFDVELEKAELCEKDKQGVGAAKMDWGSIAKDKDVPKRYHINGRGSFNYNTSDDLGAKVLVALWTFPGNWVTYYSNSFKGGCSMAKNFAPEKWKRVSLLLFGHENAECPFPPIRVDVSNFTIDNRGGQGMLKEFIYGRWKMENQIFDFTNNRVVSCGRAIVRVIPKQKEKPMPAVVPSFDNSDAVSIELMEPGDAPP